MKNFNCILFLLLFVSFGLSAQEQTDSSIVQKTLSRSRISGQWFLAYTINTLDTTREFRLKRGYLDIRTQINNRLSVRYTQDITIDREGSDAGNIETRMKYMYLKIKLNNWAIINDHYVEIGMSHRPWVDFDGKINPYRLQDEMFTDRNNIISSADLGFSWVGLLGKPLNENYLNAVSSAYPGRYGSFALGLFNGGGYSALEKNRNKTLETRISLRPLPDFVPGLQFTHAFAYGLANVAEYEAPFRMHIFALTSQSRFHSLQAQYYTGTGGHQDHYVSSNGNSYKNKGYSVLAEIKTPAFPLSVFSRYDYLQSEAWANANENLFAAGIAYRFSKSKLAAYYEKNQHLTETENIWELVLEIKF